MCHLLPMLADGLLPPGHTRRVRLVNDWSDFTIAGGHFQINKPVKILLLENESYESRGLSLGS
jgi:hypothetical protein